MLFYIISSAKASQGLAVVSEAANKQQHSDRPTTDRHPDARGMLGCITSHAYLRLRSGIVTQVETKLTPADLIL